MDTPDRITFRLLDVKDHFYEHIENTGSEPSVVIREFVRAGLNEGKIITAEDKQQIRTQLGEIKRALSPIGGNLNQIAHYFNMHDHLNESDLCKSHKELQQALKEVSCQLNDLTKKYSSK